MKGECIFWSRRPQLSWRNVLLLHWWLVLRGIHNYGYMYTTMHRPYVCCTKLVARWQGLQIYVIICDCSVPQTRLSNCFWKSVGGCGNQQSCPLHKRKITLTSQSTAGHLYHCCICSSCITMAVLFAWSSARGSLLANICILVYFWKQGVYSSTTAAAADRADVQL